MYVRKIMEPNTRPEDFRTVEPWFASTNNKWGLAWNKMATSILSNNKGTDHHKDIAKAIQKLDKEADSQKRHPGGIEISSLVLQFYRTEKANGQTVTLKALLSIKMKQDPQDRHFKNWHET